MTLGEIPWDPEHRGKVPFFEDVNQDPARIERCLAQPLAAERLQKVWGILIGKLHKCGPKQPGPTLGLERTFSDLLAALARVRRVASSYRSKGVPTRSARPTVSTPPTSEFPERLSVAVSGSSPHITGAAALIPSAIGSGVRPSLSELLKLRMAPGLR
ncbi:MAG: hypothetical protein HKL89_00905 [Candidatus Dormibacteraeota bacterium]|nr:hypothetical protein [Candidatus Dormibacteraeota bacterium]